jgi:hypothetical protein
MTPDRTGLLVVRLWIEGNAIDGFRARITEKLDSTAVEHTVSMAATPEDACTLVQRWLDAFISSN